MLFLYLYFLILHRYGSGNNFKYPTPFDHFMSIEPFFEQVFVY